MVRLRYYRYPFNVSDIVCRFRVEREVTILVGRLRCYVFATTITTSHIPLSLILTIKLIMIVSLALVLISISSVYLTLTALLTENKHKMLHCGGDIILRPTPNSLSLYGHSATHAHIKLQPITHVHEDNRAKLF